MYPLALIGFDESVCLWFVSVECTIEFETAWKTLYESHTFSFFTCWVDWMWCQGAWFTRLITGLMIFLRCLPQMHQLRRVSSFVWSPVINLESPFRAVWVRFTQTSKWRWIEANEGMWAHAKHDGRAAARLIVVEIFQSCVVVSSAKAEPEPGSFWRTSSKDFKKHQKKKKRPPFIMFV